MGVAHPSPLFIGVHGETPVVPFFLGWRTANITIGLSGWCASNKSRGHDWFLDFGLFCCRHTASPLITSEMHTSDAQSLVAFFL